MVNPFVLGIIGDSGSGKNTIADAVRDLLGPERVTDVRLDDYHRFTREERAQRGVTALNPIVHNMPLMREHLQLLRQGRQIRNRSYDHADGTFGPIRVIEPREMVLVRGLLGYPNDEMCALYDLAVFLQPEPELLFRWKLRRDVHSRGYTEAEVLKSIAHHLLDSKQFVLPQAERADLLVRQELPDWEAPDAEVRTSLVLRGRAAELTREHGLLAGMQGVECQPRDAELVVELLPELDEATVDAWGSAAFPDRYVGARAGSYTDENGQLSRRPQLAFVETFIALLSQAMRDAAAAGA